MTARDSMEAATHKALAEYKLAVAEGTWRVTADNQLVDAVLKAADKYALGAAVTRRRDQVRAADLDAALAKVRAHA